VSVEVVPLIRSNHQYSFRSGEWARIKGVKVLNGRCCFSVEFLDGSTDAWAIEDDAADYQFSPPVVVKASP
jgi:hypothetical protein